MIMRKKISLRSRIVLILSILILVIGVNSSVMIWYSYRLKTLLTFFFDKGITLNQMIDSLIIDLVNQKGYLSYYFIDGNQEWLKQLEIHRQSFLVHFGQLKEMNLPKDYGLAMNEIEMSYKTYIETKDKVIILYQEGRREIGMKIHQKSRTLFSKVLSDLDDYKNSISREIMVTRDACWRKAEMIKSVAIISIFLASFLCILLLLILTREILDPVRELSREMNRSPGEKKLNNEITVLKDQFYDLIKDMEKFSLVGKLASGAAHSIRNPLTSIKMRLFSLERSMKELSTVQKSDFKVISEEIHHINVIIQNFLEFSRPPKIKMEKISPSDVVDDSLKLLKHRLEAYKVEVILKRSKRLSEIPADPEQLIEVFVNLIVNACEAMANGGTILIQEDEEVVEEIGKVIVIRFNDNGPGIPRAIQDKIFQPFFTSKEGGTGLGLSIAVRILTEHGGWLALESEEEQGATFIVNLPMGKVKK